ncbi:magnesium transporter NIPA-domain-containing protein [Phyllosticta citribraziliensis]|uniref:Magnesium transporter NIPA-domain-containing protein n=1 Tax=Phyllosticta citribraziliensis TaxID=989973 RepID=A0ABR1LFS6_9PEZI
MDLSYEAGHSLYARSGMSSGSGEGRPAVYKVIGIILALSSGLFIGISFVLKKKGLLRANEKYNEVAGEGYGYLRNWMWWTGMTLMIIGEVCNFVAYAFVDAILVTPMGALSVVVTAILSAIFLKERLSFVGKVGCFNCIVGSVVIVINAPEQSAVATIQDMKKLVIAPGFLSYAGVVIVGCAVVAIWVAPRWAKKTMVVYISICSMIGGLSVVATQGLGAAIVAQIGGTPQFNQWFLYVLFVFVVATLLTEIIYLNKALNLFNAALVTPTYYVFFTSSTIVTSAILFQGFKGTAATISTVIMGFLQICAGVILLQLSKSAKDVPDTAVFTGDLDQVRTVAEQEEPEYEPRADTLRGSASIIRTFSQARQKREAVEAKTLQHEYMQPIGEFENIEWDGLRRRRTVVSSSGHSIERRKTVHPPLGMSHFPAPESDDGTDSESEVHPGFFSRMSMRRKRPQSQPQHSSSHPVPLESISVGVKSEDSDVPPVPPLPDKTSMHDFAAGHDGSGESPHVYGLPPGLRDNSDASDTAYHSLGPSSGHLHWASNITTKSPGSKSPNLEPPRPPPHAVNPSSSNLPAGAGKRQFSFQNPFSRQSAAAGERRPTSPPERPMSARSGLSFLHHHKRGHSANGGGAAATATASSATEEERLGLVKGDSQTFLGQTQTHTTQLYPPDADLDLDPLDEADDSFASGLGFGEQPPGYSIAGAGFAAAPRDIRVPAPGVPAGALGSGERGERGGGSREASPPRAFGAVRKVDTDESEVFGGGDAEKKGKF